MLFSFYTRTHLMWNPALCPSPYSPDWLNQSCWHLNSLKICLFLFIALKCLIATLAKASLVSNIYRSESYNTIKLGDAVITQIGLQQSDKISGPKVIQLHQSVKHHDHFKCQNADPVLIIHELKIRSYLNWKLKKLKDLWIRHGWSYFCFNFVHMFPLFKLFSNLK